MSKDKALLELIDEIITINNKTKKVLAKKTDYNGSAFFGRKHNQEVE